VRVPSDGQLAHHGRYGASAPGDVEKPPTLRAGRAPRVAANRPAGTRTSAAAPASSRAGAPTGAPSRAPTSWRASPPTTDRSTRSSTRCGSTSPRGSQWRAPNPSTQDTRDVRHHSAPFARSSDGPPKPNLSQQPPREGVPAHPPGTLLRAAAAPPKCLLEAQELSRARCPSERERRPARPIRRSVRSGLGPVSLCRPRQIVRTLWLSTWSWGRAAQASRSRPDLEVRHHHHPNDRSRCRRPGVLCQRAVRAGDVIWPSSPWGTAPISDKGG